MEVSCSQINILANGLNIYNDSSLNQLILQTLKIMIFYFIYFTYNVKNSAEKGGFPFLFLPPSLSHFILM